MTTTSGAKVQPESALVWRAIHLSFVAIFGALAFAVPAAVHTFRTERNARPE